MTIKSRHKLGGFIIVHFPQAHQKVFCASLFKSPLKTINAFIAYKITNPGFAGR